MFKCLQESLAQPDFGQACRAQVEERGQRMQEDYRLDYGVARGLRARRHHLLRLLRRSVARPVYPNPSLQCHQ